MGGLGSSCVAVSLGAALLYALELRFQGSKYRLWRPSVKKSAGISELGYVDGEATGAPLLCLEHFLVGQSLATGATNTGQNNFQTPDKGLPVSFEDLEV